MLEPALAHRLILTPEARLAGRRAAGVLNQIASRTDAPMGEAFSQ
jgi:MoxR-like ATPase